MKFVYGYKTHENETREGVIVASSRDAVYRELKGRGIRPFKVVPAPGFVNWLSSLGKRTYAIGLLVIAVCVAVVLNCVLSSEIEARDRLETAAVVRHQVYGDPALMDDLMRSGYASVFSNKGDRVLAYYAQPGQHVELPFSKDEVATSLKMAVSEPDDVAVCFNADDPREYRELKRIVLWMRGELRRYLSNGKGSPAKYAVRLAERQEHEEMIYYRAKQDLSAEKDPEKWRRINSSLRNVGLKTIPIPTDLNAGLGVR